MLFLNIILFGIGSVVFITLISLGNGETIMDANVSTNADQPASSELSFYRVALRAKRIEQRKAVLKLSEINELKKQTKMVEPVLDKMFEVLKKTSNKFTNTTKIEFANLTLAEKNDLSLVIENILFMADIILRLPDSSQKVLKKHSDVREVIVANVQLVQATGILEDNDLQAFDLMLQELNLIPRKDDYINREEALRILRSKASKETKKEKKKIKRTLMSGPSAGEL